MPRPATAGGADRARHPINGATLAMLPRHAIGVAARARVSSRMHAGAGWVRPSRSSGRYNDRSLWVSYTDVYTIRRRVLGVAQRVREQLMLPTERSPELILPRDERLRHGFWFMRFGNVEDALAVQKSLDGQRFQSECGSLEGLLQMDSGRRPLDVRVMLNVSRQSPDPVIEWLDGTFRPYGVIARIYLPRVKSNWDGGFGFVDYIHREDADAALNALDGRPSIVPGCRLFVDFAKAVDEPLVRLRPPPVLPAQPRHYADAEQS